MKARKLNYRFHNPNSAEITAKFVLKTFIEVNEEKVKRVIQESLEPEKEELTDETLKQA